MKTKTTSLLLLAGCLQAGAQPNAVAVAEQAFATMAIDSSTKKAFLYYLDSNSILLHGGKPHRALPYWQKLPNDVGRLYWKPVYTGMAASSDIGFSTGPFEQKASPAEPVRESGNYSSIWIRNKQGEWKVLIDMGVPYKPSLFTKEWATQATVNLTPATGGANWETIERTLINSYNEKGPAAFLPYLSKSSWFNVQGQQPMHTINDIETGLKQLPANLLFGYMGGAMAAAGDLFYTYGTVTRGDQKEHYLRVWGHESGGWRLLLQVLKWPQ